MDSPPASRLTCENSGKILAAEPRLQPQNFPDVAQVSLLVGYPLDNAIDFPNTHPVDRDLASG